MFNMIEFAAQQTVEQPAAEPTTAPVENTLVIEFDDQFECEGPVVETRLGVFRARYVISASVRFSGRTHVTIQSTYGWLFEEIGGDRSDMLLDSELSDLREACEWLRRNHSVSYAHTATRVAVTLR